MAAAIIFGFTFETIDTSRICFIVHEQQLEIEAGYER